MLRSPLPVAVAFVFIVLLHVDMSSSDPCPVPVLRGLKHLPKVVLAGSDVKLKCKLKQTDETQSVKTYWFKDDQPLYTVNYPRMMVSLNKWLRIKGIIKEDEGTYTCQAKNRCGNTSLTYYIRVQSPTIGPLASLLPAAPNFTVSRRILSRHLIARPVGDPVKLDCSARGFPAPNVVWYKNGKRFDSREEAPVYLGRYQYVLVLKFIKPADSGHYTCNVSNVHGWINHTYEVDAVERIRAKPLVYEMQNVTAFVGTNVTIKCVAISDLMPYFQWLKWIKHSHTNETFKIISPQFTRPEKRLNPHSFVLSSVYLVLVNVSLNDSGRYSCLVANPVGSDWVDIYLDVISEEFGSTVNRTKPETGKPTGLPKREVLEQVDSGSGHVHINEVLGSIVCFVLVISLLALLSLGAIPEIKRSKQQTNQPVNQL